MTLNTGSGVSKKTVFLLIALLTIGMYFLPTTLSLFSGQHTFINGTEVSCRKCHEDIYSQIADAPTGSPHLSGFADNCNGCHRTGGILILFQDDLTAGISQGEHALNITADPNVHAAVTVECVFCHDLIISNSTTSDPQEIRGSDEAHSSFYDASNQSTILKGGNEACIGCHTHTMVNITWIRKTGYNMNVDILSGTWNVSSSLNQSTVNTSSAGQ